MNEISVSISASMPHVRGDDVMFSSSLPVPVKGGFYPRKGPDSHHQTLTVI